MEFYSKNKFEKLVHLVGFIIRSRRPSHIEIAVWETDLADVNLWAMQNAEAILRTSTCQQDPSYGPARFMCVAE